MRSTAILKRIWGNRYACRRLWRTTDYRDHGHLRPDLHGLVREHGQAPASAQIFDLYVNAFHATPSSYCTAVNAAAKSVFLNELGTAADFATRVETLVTDKITPNDHWKSATAAEAQLILRGFDKAATAISSRSCNRPASWATTARR
jgi:hypothetical protein